MDYELHVSSLENQKDNFSKQLKDKATALVNSCDSFEINGEISNLKKKVTDASKKIESGYTNYEKWMNGYVSELTETEENIAKYEGPAINGDFYNTFAKILIPSLKSDASKEDKQKLTDLGKIGAPTITLEQVQNCSNVNEYLKLMMPVYEYYCRNYK